MNEDQLPQTEDLTESEQWVVLAYRRLVEDTRMVKYQSEVAIRAFMDNVNRHVIDDVKGKQ